MSRRGLSALVVGVMGPFLVAAEVRADLTLTSAAAAAGYQLQTFASDFPNSGTNGIGPLGVTFTSTGDVMVADNYRSNLTVFPDQNNLSYGSFPQVGGNYSYSADGLTTDNGTVYLASYFRDAVYALNNDGTLKQTIATNLGDVDGITVDPANGHLIVSSTNGVLDINLSNNPATVTNLSKTVPLGFTGVTDGLTFSPDGKTLYAAVGGNYLEAVDMATGKLLFQVQIAGADGTALGTGTLAGNLFVNTNFGKFYEYNLASQTLTLLADGGSRGDFVAVDPNGTLLITQTDRIDRLVAPAGGGFGNPVPELSSMYMVLAAVPGGLLYCWSRRRAVSAGRRPRAAA